MTFCHQATNFSASKKTRNACPHKSNIVTLKDYLGSLTTITECSHAKISITCMRLQNFSLSLPRKN